MRGRGKSKKRLVLAMLGVAAAIVLGGCDWPMFGYNAALTHSSPDEAINSANVSTVQSLFTSSGQFGSPVESNGVVYAVGPFVDYSSEVGQNYLYAFDANGVTNCSGLPNQCTPLWAAPVGGFTTGAPAVANGVVYVSTTPYSTSPGALYAFDANGVTNCSGTPKMCQPLWTAPDGNTVQNASPTVTNGVVYVASDGSAAYAFDADGVTNCSGTPKVCSPLWTDTNPTGPGVAYSSPAVAAGVLYTTTSNDQLYAFSADGTTNCSGTPTVCSPLWTGTMGTTSAGLSSPAVSGGVVYAESNDDKLFAFDAGGVTSCSGTPATCSPLWTAALPTDPSGAYLSPAVANGIVYAGSDNLEAFDANGVTNCSGTPKTCTPLWSYNVGVDGASPSVADGLVFICCGGAGGTSGFDLLAFDASGVTNCSGTPKACSPLWSGMTDAVAVGPAAIANGKVYLTDNWFGELFLNTHLYVWVLPPPTTTVGLPSNNATVTDNQWLDASASAGVTQVQYELTGGTLNHSVIATATPTSVGWLANWNSTTVPNGVYTLQSAASYGGEVSGTSAGITITVANSG